MGIVVGLALLMLASAARVEADDDTRTVTARIELPTPKEAGAHPARCAWLLDRGWSLDEAWDAMKAFADELAG